MFRQQYLRSRNQLSPRLLATRPSVSFGGFTSIGADNRAKHPGTRQTLLDIQRKGYVLDAK